METKRRMYSKRVVYGLGAFALVMVILSSVFSREHHSAASQRNQALSELVALETRALQSSDPSLAMQLALVAYNLSPTPQARSALVDITAGEMPTRLLGSVGLTSMALGDDGHRLAIAYRASDQLKLYALRYSQLKWLATVDAGSGSAKVDSVAISSGGHLVAVGDSRGEVRIWSLTNPARPDQIATVKAGSGAVRGLSFSPGGSALAAADADGRVQRWSLAKPGRLVTAAPLVAPGGRSLEAVSYSHDGKTLAATGRHGELVVWPAHAGTDALAAVSAGTTALTAVAYSPDGHTLAAGANDGVIRLWRLDRGGRPAAERRSLTGAGDVTSLAFSRDGRYLAAGSEDDVARIWATRHWDEVGTLPHPATVTGVAFTDGDRHLLSSDAAGTARIWQFPPAGSRTAASAITALTFSPDRPELEVTGSRAGEAPERWDVVNEWRPAPAGSWDATPIRELDTRYGALGPTTTGTITSTTQLTTTTSSSPTTPPPDLHAGHRALAETEASTKVNGYALSPNYELFAVAGADHLVWLWDVTTPRHPQLLAKLTGFSRWVYSVVFSNDSQTLFASGADHMVRIWNVGDPQVPVELANSPLTGPDSTITKLVLSPDGRTLAAATIEGHVWLWAVGTPRKASLSGVQTAAGGKLTALAFSPSDNTLVAGGSDRRLTFWHYRPYQAVDRLCALAGTPITPGEWEQYVPGAPYAPPCQNWTPPVPLTADASN